MKSNRALGRFCAGLAMWCVVLGCGSVAHAESATQPDLVLLIVADQLRAEVPDRLHDRFVPGGFRRLMDTGTRYRRARYAHASTVTCIGHATLATGGNPPQHGIVANDWFDAESGRTVNCVDDDRYVETGAAPGSGGGKSPQYLASSTFGDELVLASGGRSRVFAVSIKDRGAVMLGGRSGKAFWYSNSAGHFVSSSYYFERYPDWVRRWNAGNPADRNGGAVWELLQERSAYDYGDRDDRPYERPVRCLGRTFPHVLPPVDQGAALYACLRETPMGDELILSFVEALVAAEQPGRRGSTDVLAVSFSASDYIGHAFGPESLEAEDNLMRLDRTLARLLELVDRQVGMDRTLVVLGSDHGIGPTPEFLAERGVRTGRLGRNLLFGQVNAALALRYGTEERLVAAFDGSGIHLDRLVLARLGLGAGPVERAVAEELGNVPGIAFALTRASLLQGTIPRTPEALRVAAAFHPRRSGDVIAVQEKFWYLDADPGGNAATHGSPFPYDTDVPLMFAGSGIGHRVVDRAVAPRDLAPTLSAVLNVARPSGAVGELLCEVLEAWPAAGCGEGSGDREQR